MKKKIKVFVACVILISIIIQIIYVNKHARIPDINIIKAGDELIYEGCKYTVIESVIYGFEDYNDKFFNGELTDKRTNSDCKVILVTVKLEIDDEINIFSPDIYIEYGHIANEFDVFNFKDLNDNLIKGEFHSGDTILLPYEIYKENMTVEMWNDVMNLSYRLVLGTYPIKNCMDIGELREGYK
ncbi:MAG: hypothetical protein E7259_10010 [Lachnospiraceae bacterium]|nr:hypothetical protein [Lachnospiraceae bacterium]